MLSATPNTRAILLHNDLPYNSSSSVTGGSMRTGGTNERDPNYKFLPNKTVFKKLNKIRNITMQCLELYRRLVDIYFGNAHYPEEVEVKLSIYLDISGTLLRALSLIVYDWVKVITVVGTPV